MTGYMNTRGANVETRALKDPLKDPIYREFYDSAYSLCDKKIDIENRLDRLKESLAETNDANQKQELECAIADLEEDLVLLCKRQEKQAKAYKRITAIEATAEDAQKELETMGALAEDAKKELETMRPLADFGERRQAQSRKGADTTNSRFEKARAFAKQYAKKEYDDGSTQRPGEMARDILDIITENLIQVGLKRPPVKRTVKEWIYEFAPDELKVKSGAPSRNT